MAVSRKTQKDVGKYQAKLVGPLTIRQTIFVGIACVAGIILWNVAGAMQLSSTDKLGAVIIVAAPIASLGIINPYGMTCLEFIRQYYEYHILSTKRREYVSDITDAKIVVESTEAEENQEDGKKGKKKAKQEPSSHKKLKEFPEYF